MQPDTTRYTGRLVMTLLGVAFIIGGMWGGIIGGALTLWVLDPQNQQSADVLAQNATPTQTPTVTSTPTSLPSPSATPTRVFLTPTPSIESAVDKVLSSVVTVINDQHTPDSYTETAVKRIVGSGVIVDNQGYIVTNAHVVNNTKTLSVLLSDGTAYSAALIVQHLDLDLAMLKIESADLAVVSWGDSSTIRLGQPVVAIGSALGDFPNSVTVGVVSGLDRALALDEYVVQGLIQTDAAINQGNSGGPLINLNGEVVGINTFMIREDHDRGMAQGIGFAIPASSAKIMVASWLEEATNTTSIPANSVTEGEPLPVLQSNSGQ